MIWRERCRFSKSFAHQLKLDLIVEDFDERILQVAVRCIRDGGDSDDHPPVCDFVLGGFVLYRTRANGVDTRFFSLAAVTGGESAEYATIDVATSRQATNAVSRIGPPLLRRFFRPAMSRHNAPPESTTKSNRPAPPPRPPRPTITTKAQGAHNGHRPGNPNRRRIVAGSGEHVVRCRAGIFQQMLRHRRLPLQPSRFQIRPCRSRRRERNEQPGKQHQRHTGADHQPRGARRPMMSDCTAASLANQATAIARKVNTAACAGGGQGGPMPVPW